MEINIYKENTAKKPKSLPKSQMTERALSSWHALPGTEHYWSPQHSAALLGNPNSTTDCTNDSEIWTPMFCLSYPGEFKSKLRNTSPLQWPMWYWKPGKPISFPEICAKM